MGGNLHFIPCQNGKEYKFFPQQNERCYQFSINSHSNVRNNWRHCDPLAIGSSDLSPVTVVV